MRQHGFVENLQSKITLLSFIWIKIFTIVLVLLSYLPDKSKTARNLLQGNSFPPHISAVFLQNASKILAKIAVEEVVVSSERFICFCNEFEQLLGPYLHNQNLEIQERASNLWQIITIMKDMWSSDPSTLKSLLDEDEPKVGEGEKEIHEKEKEEAKKFVTLFYAYALNPVAAKAQHKVPVPAGLDLDAPFEEDSEDEVDDDDDEADEDEENTNILVRRKENNIRLIASDDDDEDQDVDEGEEEDEGEEFVKAKKSTSKIQSRRFEMENNPNYLKSKASTSATSSKAGPSKKAKKTKAIKNKDVEPAFEAFDHLNAGGDEMEMANAKKSVVIPGLVSSEKYLLSMKANKKTKSKTTKKMRKKGGKKQEEEEDEEEEEESVPRVTIRALEMPDGFDPNSVDDEEDKTSMNDLDPHKALANVSFDDIIAAEKEAKRAAAAAAAATSKKVTKTKKSLTMLKEGSETKTTTLKKKAKKTTKKAVNDLIVGDEPTLLGQINPKPEVKKKKKKVIKKKTKTEE